MILVIREGRLLQAEDLSPQDLKVAHEGGMEAFRTSGGEWERLVVYERDVDSPTNSFDETRQDQAIDGKIYEPGRWERLPWYDGNEPDFIRKDKTAPLSDELLEATGRKVRD